MFTQARPRIYDFLLLSLAGMVNPSYNLDKSRWSTLKSTDRIDAVKYETVPRSSKVGNSCLGANPSSATSTNAWIRKMPVECLQIVSEKIFLALILYTQTSEAPNPGLQNYQKAHLTRTH
jgi:hypothetical protein